MGISAGDMPFRTSDAILAFSLHAAGVPWFEEKTATETFAVPCYCLYDEEILKRLGFTGMTMEEAASAAHSQGKKGHIEFLFKMVPTLMDLTAAYRDEVAQIEQGEGRFADRLLTLAGLITDDSIPRPEALLRIACITLKMRLPFMSMWKQVSPLIRIRNKGGSMARPAMGRNSRGELVQGHAVKYPGYKVVSLNATEKTRKHLKL